jgi:hypothetical protein
VRPARTHQRLTPGSTRVPSEMYPDPTVVMMGIDLHSTPPCEIKEFEPGTTNIIVCGKPSVERIKMKFPCCGAVYIRFVCAPCLDLLKQGGDTWECDEGCDREVKPEWTVI